jgi:hypothetical protein
MLVVPTPSKIETAIDRHEAPEPEQRGNEDRGRKGGQDDLSEPTRLHDAT